MNKIFSGALFGISIGLGAMSSGMAQSSTDSGGVLEEIVVTAQKRSEDLQKAAVSIDVVQRGEIERRGITTLDQALKTVPGVRLRDAAQGGASIFIRGVGNNEVDATLNNQPAVAINVDGVVNTQQSGVTDSMFDVERVEVLRGPQGTLYGSSAAGGVVNIVLAQPKHEFEVRGRAQIGNYNARQLEGVINVPLGDQLALRLTGSNNKRDGYVNGPDFYTYNCPAGAGPPVPTGACVDGPLGPGTQAVPFRGGNFGAIDTTTYRAKAKYDPADWLSITGTYEKTKLVNTSGAQITYADLQAGNLYANAPTVGGGSRYEVFSANVVAQLGNFAELTLLPTRRTSTALPTIGPTSAPPNLSKQTQDTYELRLASRPSSKFVWTTGVYVSKASGDFTTSITTASFPTTTGYSLLQLNRPFDTWNIFGQATYPVTDTFRVTAGARYSHSEPGYSYQLYRSHFAGSTLIVDELTPTVTETIKQNKVTPKIGIEYDLAPKSMIYAQISTGYKAGGLSLADTGPMGSTISSPGDVHLRPYEPEVTTTLEVGSKNRFLNDTLQINADVFYSKWDNMQVQAFDFRPGADTTCTGPFCDYVQSIYNADKSTQYGFEMDTTWLATADDKFGLNVSALHGKYGTLRYVLFGATTDLTGKTMANSPSLAGSASYEHIFRLADNITLTPGINEQFTTKYSTTHEVASGQARFAGGEVPGHHTTDISLTLAGGKWSVSAFGRNVWNKIVAQNIGGGGDVSPSDPRIWGVSVVGSY